MDHDMLVNLLAIGLQTAFYLGLILVGSILARIGWAIGNCWILYLINRLLAKIGITRGLC